MNWLKLIQGFERDLTRSAAAIAGASLAVEWKHVADKPWPIEEDQGPPTFEFCDERALRWIQGKDE